MVLLLQVARVGEVVDACAEEGFDGGAKVKGDDLGRKGARAGCAGGCGGVGAGMSGVWVVDDDDGKDADGGMVLSAEIAAGVARVHRPIAAGTRI